MKKRPLFFLLLLLAPALPAQRKAPPMVDPSLDRPDQPFCYFSRPTDQLGVMDGRDGFQLTCEGYLYTRKSELLFMAGPGLAPVHQRIRTRLEGRIPVDSYSVTRDGVRYEWTMFAQTPDLNPLSPLYAFVRIRTVNPGATPARAVFGAAMRYKGRTARSRADRRHPFRFTSRYEVKDGMVIRDGMAILFLPDEPAPEIRATLDAPYRGPFKGSDLDVLSDTPVCPAIWKWDLAPGEIRTVDLVLPFYLVSAEKARGTRDRLIGAFDRYLRATVDAWHSLFERAAEVRIPEAKAHQTFWNSLTNMAIARDEVEPGVYVQNVNEEQYNHFWPRDSSYFMMAWWYLGLPEEGRRVVDNYFRIAKPDGTFRADPENISPFAVARWFRLTGDLDYAKKAFPLLWRNFLWLKAARAKDPLGLMPPKGPYDNEAINGHYTGHNFYNICALREAAAMARALGKNKEAKEIQAEYEAFRDNFLTRLKPLVEKYGFIPPGMDTGAKGANWGNLVGSYPTEVLPPDSPWIAKTDDKLRREMFREGLLIYNGGRWWAIHHYSTIKVTYSDLLRGRDDLVVKDLYSLLVHTSGTNGGFEFCIYPWSNRDFGHNFSPHGWFHNKFASLVRLMLVRTWGRTLHLLSALPPAWVDPGKRLTAKGMPTVLGYVDLDLQGTTDGAVLDLRLPRKGEGGPAGIPEQVLLHIPWYVKLKEAKADGKVLEPRGRVLSLPLDTRQVVLTFDRDRSQWIDYNRAVRAWKAEYARRFREWKKKNPGAEPWVVFPEKRFQTREERAKRARPLKEKLGEAVGGTTSASSSRPGHGPGLAADGDWSEGAWAPAPGDKNPWWEVDLGRVVPLQRIFLVPGAGRTSFGARILGSPDGTTWNLLAELGKKGRWAPPGPQLAFFPPTPCRYVKVRVLGKPGKGIAEVGLFRNPPAWRKPASVRGEEGDNLALGRPVFSSPWEQGWPPERSVDGRTSYRDGYWAGAAPPPQWLVVDLGEAKRISRARIYFYAGDQRAYAFSLEGSLDGRSWELLADFSREPRPAAPKGLQVTFGPLRARYVKITVTKNTANTSAHIAELQVYAG